MVAVVGVFFNAYRHRGLREASALVLSRFFPVPDSQQCSTFCQQNSKWLESKIVLNNWTMTKISTSQNYESSVKFFYRIAE